MAWERRVTLIWIKTRHFTVDPQSFIHNLIVCTGGATSKVSARSAYATRAKTVRCLVTIVCVVMDNVQALRATVIGVAEIGAMSQKNRLLVLSAAERARLQQLARTRTLAARIVVRSRIVLLLADGAVPSDVARRLSVSRATVRLWSARFLQLGVDGLLREKPGRGRPPLLDLDERLMLLTDEGRSARALAAILGVSAATISRWRNRIRATDGG
jgi:transposase